MPADRDTLIATLKRIHLFQGVDEDKLGEIADLMETIQLPAGATLYKEGDDADYFYIVIDGQVRVSRNDYQANKVVTSLLRDEDYFGEEVLENNWPRQIGVETVMETDLARVSVPNFITMLEILPVLSKRLQMILDSYRLILKTRLDWLDDNEAVYFIARRHLIILFSMILPPILAGAFAIILFAVWYLTAPMLSSLILLAVSIPAALVWLVWNYIDWSNDYYIITNQRVVYQERVVLLYDSRQESLMEQVQSSSINTSQWGRWLGFGAVAIRTVYTTLLFRDVAFPQQVQAMLQEYQLRAQYNESRTEVKRIKSIIDKRIRLGPDQPGLSRGAKAAPPQPDPMRVFLSTMFHLRFESGGSVTFRTHWFILLQKVFIPTIILLAMGAVFVYSAMKQFSMLSVQATCGVLFLFGMIIFGWWFYQYIDWHNDVYVITPDQVVDVNKKPLAREERQAAPLKNIINIEAKRLGFIGLLLNYGTVYINVGNQTLTFDNVFNPSEVQRELFHRLNKRSYDEKVKQGEAERKRMAEWIATYNEWNKENQVQPRAPKPPARPGF
jgi:hypothetical protein